MRKQQSSLFNYGPIQHRRSLALTLLAAFTLFVFLLIPTAVFLKSRLEPTLSTTSGFRVQGNKIFDPNGKRFIVKGVTAVYGRFSGGDANGFGLTNYRNAQRDLDNLKLSGVNLVRIFVSADFSTLSSSDPNYVADYMQELDNVVRWTTQRKMVAEVANSFTHDFAKSLQFVRRLAARYKSNPFVWIEPMNEPNCDNSTGDPSKCANWAYWQQQYQQYVLAIRNAEMTSPIVVNTIYWSWVLTKIAAYPLNDSNIIYGVHRYPTPHTGFTFNAADQADCNNLWANLSGNFAIIIDEVGPTNGGKVYLAWAQNFIDYVTNWVQIRGGAGAIAFVFYWSDGNGMTGDPQQYNSNNVWDQWGKIFYNSYLTKVE
jgi:hypothetical protein